MNDVKLDLQFATELRIMLPVPVAFLRECFDLNPASLSGLRWRTRLEQSVQWNARFAGKPAFTALCNGYHYGRLTFAKRVYNLRAHHVVWALATGAWPSDQIDHKNGNRADNRLENLREASSAENSQNQARLARNTSGFPGVNWDKQKWVAKICVGGQQKYLGRFSDFDDACHAYLSAKAILHPFAPTVRQA
jgi:hypothetical protein